MSELSCRNLKKLWFKNLRKQTSNERKNEIHCKNPKDNEEVPTTAIRAGNRHRDSLFLAASEDRERREDDEQEEKTREAMSG